ncbi:MAG: TonB-dependent receptor plug domain-containing protein [Bacteroidetes bacterium]|nr:TonB-dependent receptor plug domain-containing protein [Bacteroidota bacterium]
MNVIHNILFIIFVIILVMSGEGLVAQSAATQRAAAVSNFEFAGRVTGGSDSTELPQTDLVLMPEGTSTQTWLRTDAAGRFAFAVAAPGPYSLTVFCRGYRTRTLALNLQPGLAPMALHLDLLEEQLDDVVIEVEANPFGLRRMNSVEGTALYAAKKTEVIELALLTGNKSGNAARQVYAQVAGLNVWESDGAGLQLGIGGRGLSPNRTSNFNTRQDGYDIAADALGYPESYYTPPVEALERIEVVRGAASLQYGTQFGGLLNFVLRKPPSTDGVSGQSRSTLGSFGYLGQYTELGFKKGAWSGIGLYQFRRTDGWRENSGFDQHTAYTQLTWQPAEAHQLSLALTHMNYLAQQPGGLTDAGFATDPRLSQRSRNWFAVEWNVASLRYEFTISPAARLEFRQFALLGSRLALGDLGPINRADPYQERDLLSDTYRNTGQEGRYLQRYSLAGQDHTLLLGYRLYRGFTERQQGLGDAGWLPTFRYLNPDALESSDYQFPSANYAAFAENIFQISDRFVLTPGLRAERIRTQADGYYRVLNTDLAGNVLLDTTYTETLDNGRNLILAGLGAAYQLRSPGSGFRGKGDGELYANISQNYRGITFNDLRIANPNFQVDSALRDERGFSADIGLRGTRGRWLHLDASLFLLMYRDRIGQILTTDPVTLRTYRFRTNVADSRAVGLELLTEVDWIAAFSETVRPFRVMTFVNLSLTDARYIRSEEPAIDGNEVEEVPPLTLRTGITAQYRQLRSVLQYHYVAGHYTDATNAEAIAQATAGRIPGYGLLDASVEYTWGRYRLECGVSNLMNTPYFTRRAVGYPGPGIIPGDGRGGYLTWGVVW